MCIVLPAKVLAVTGDEAEIEMPGGMRATAGLTLCPTVEVGQYVLVDRGLVLKIVETEEALAILAMYEEIGEMMDADEAGLGFHDDSPIAAWMSEEQRA